MKIGMISAGIVAVILLCACSQQLPLISHAHIGHALTAWKDTPNKQGLFIVAENEIQRAKEEAEAALVEQISEQDMDARLVNILQALNPDLGTPAVTDYGAVRALSGATDHMVFASESEDASKNMKQMVHEYSKAQQVVIKRVKLAVKQTQYAMQADVTERRGLISQLLGNLNAISDGIDLDGDGRIGSRDDEFGLQQLRDIVSNGLNNEKPAYHPVGKKYLFGLVRLPDGGWAYRFDATNLQGEGGYDYGDVSY